MKISLIFNLLMASAVVLSGCTVGPNYQPPEMTLPDTFHADALVQGHNTVVDIKEWWQKFNDPVLNSIISAGIASNLDLRLAREKLREVRARYGITAGDLWPALNASTGYAQSRVSENTPQGQKMADPTSDLYQAGFDASWEIDIVGGIKREMEAASADIAATLAGNHSVLVTLLGEIVKNYTELQGTQRQLAITTDHLHLQEQIVALVKSKHQAGLNSYLDVARAEAQLATTNAQLPLLTKMVKNYHYRLVVLSGIDLMTLAQELPTVPAQPIAIPATDLAIGIPAELLRRRPDIRKAEMELAAASARIGVATADFFPRLSLTGLFGWQSNNAADLGTSASRAWSIGPALKWPLFTAGRVTANLEVQNAKYAQALTLYEQTIAKAVEEVENAVAGYSSEYARVASLNTAVQANRLAMTIATELYEKGLADFLAVLEAERSVLTTASQLAQSQTQMTTSIAALYKALGGGWE